MHGIAQPAARPGCVSARRSPSALYSGARRRRAEAAPALLSEVLAGRSGGRPSILDTMSVTDIVCIMAEDKAFGPLTPAVLHVLLALSAGDRHGYGIMKQVESDSLGKVKMGPGTLYGSIGRMIKAGLVRESDKTIDPAMDDERRVYYTLTGLGRETLAAELQRYRDVVTVAKKMRLSPST